MSGSSSPNRITMFNYGITQFLACTRERSRRTALLRVGYYIRWILVRFFKTRPALSSAFVWSVATFKKVYNEPAANLLVASRVMSAISYSTFLFTRVYASTIARRVRMCVCRKSVLSRKLPVPQIQMSNFWAWDNRSRTLDYHTNTYAEKRRF